MALPQYPSYKLNPLINKEKIFQFTPPSSIDSQSPLPPLSSEWLVELEDFCRKEKRDLKKKCFKSHLSPFTIHVLNMRVGPSQSLIEGLQLIYRRLRGDLDPFLGSLSESNCTAIIAKLIEDIEACTDGFENRVKHIVTALNMPANLPQLIYEVRRGLVENVSASLTGEVHNWNQVTKVAAAQGIGIKANFDNDTNDTFGDLSNKKIVCELEKEFKERFVPFNLSFLLVDQLRGLLAHIGYIGPQQDGYTVGVAERLVKQVKCYLSKEIVEQMNWQDFFISDEDDDFNIVIRDLNWRIIRQCFFQTLSHENYFTPMPSQATIYNLMDCVYFSHLFSSDNHLLGIESQYLDENSIFNLKKIKTDFPAFWQNLRLGFQSNPDLTGKIPLLFAQLGKAPLNLMTLEKIVSLFELDLVSLINDDSMADLTAKLIQKKTDHYNILMLAVSKQPEVLSFILKFLAEHPSLIDKETLREMFLHTNENGCNVLMLAASSSPQKLNFLLTFITDNPTLIDKEALQQMFLQKNTYIQDIVKQSGLILFYELINQPLHKEIHLKQLGEIIQRHGLDALNIAAHFQPDGFNLMLIFATKHPDLFDEAILKQVIAKNTGYGLSFFVIKSLLEKYLEGISDRKAQNITHTTRFFNHNFGYSTQQKEIAALKLKEILETGLEEPEPVKDLISLKQSYPALSNGRLGRLFNLCHKVASDETALVELKAVMNISRQEPQMPDRIKSLARRLHAIT